MPFDLDDLRRCLRLREVEPGLREGDNLDLGYYRVFGGQLLAQALVAAAEASPGKTVKSLHVLFPREGDTAHPVRYRVEVLQEGRTFGTTSVVAHQGDTVIAAATVSVHAEEPGLHRTDDPPPVGAPDAAVPTDLGMVPWEVRVVDGVDLADTAAGPPELRWWMRTPPLGERPLAVDQALLAHATDLTLIGTALRPFEGLSQAQSTVTLRTAVTSHSLWFHQPFRLDDWVLVAQHSPVVAGARAFGRGDVFAGGELVASFAQESMVRQVEPAG